MLGTSKTEESSSSLFYMESPFSLIIIFSFMGFYGAFQNLTIFKTSVPF